MANSASHSSLSREKLAVYCKRERKPPPTYEHKKEDASHTVRVYVAKTCGWVCSDLKPTKAEAEESAAAKLVEKLHLQ